MFELEVQIENRKNSWINIYTKQMDIERQK